MKAYYGFKVKGNVAEFLAQFKDFQWIPNVCYTGFLGVEIHSTEYVAKNIDFPKILENYLIISKLREDKKLTNKLISYQKKEYKPIIFVPLEYQNKYFENWTDYELFKSQNNKKYKP